MTPLDVLTIVGAIVCYSYTGFLWKSDESHLEKVLKKNTLTCRLCNKTRNRCCCGSSYLAANEDLYKAKANCSGSSTVDFICDDGRRVTMRGLYRSGARVLLLRKTEGEVTTHYYLDERIRASRK
jgi:hypothetical protein